MIIERAFYREALQATVAIVVVLLAILTLFFLTSVLGRAARGDYPQHLVLAMLFWQMVRRVDLVLPLGLYLAVLLTLSRWYRDSEMTVLQACGVGLLQLLRPVMLYALIVAALVAAASFYLSPLASREIERVKAEGNRRPELAGIAPGAFNESVSGRVVYAERVTDEGTLERVFVANVGAADRPRVIMSETGFPFVDQDTGDRFVALQRGTAYEGTPGLADYRVVRFERYDVRLNPRPPVALPEKVEGASNRALLASPEKSFAAEWHWRLAKPLFVPVLAIFALVLAYTDARRGRFANLFAAVLVYFIYSNLLGLGETFIKKGRVPDGVGLWWVHGFFLVIGLYLLARRNAHRPLLAWAR